MPKATLAKQRPLIAIVDDDAGARNALAFMLELDGYKIRAFGSGSEFVAAEELPDCLIVDQNMPSMTGLQVVEGLRRAGARLPVIMITATPSQRFVRLAKEVGVDQVVEKPNFDGALSQAVERCLKPGKQEG